jgi:glutamyl-tRNA reductase
MMNKTNIKNLSDFYAIGISYKKADAKLRGQFSIDHEQYSRILINANEIELNELFILSTCNRTEIYGFAQNPSQLIQLLCNETIGDESIFNQIAYTKKGFDAIEHLYEVSAGLDSQILGDYEIIGQIKLAVKFAKEKGFVGAFLERLVNSVLQSSKSIKNNTELSGGTVSVSFAAIQYICKNIQAVADKKILLIGTGKMGRSACRNIVDYLGTKKITLINRTEEKAATLAGELGLIHAPLKDLAINLDEADIILVATNSNEPTILHSHLSEKGEKLIIDLTVPSNVESSVQHLSNVTLINVDELSKLKDETLAKREAEVPKAKAIIAEHIQEFIEWYEMRKHVPVLKAVKSKLEAIQSDPLFIPLYTHETDMASNQRIQRVINGMASKMKVHNQKGCHYIEAINEFIA